jgi:4-hydroxybenzoate polyprenyltransferase
MIQEYTKIIKLVKFTSLKIRKSLKIGKPAVKGSIMVLLGIFNSRVSIGVEIFTKNLIYGPVAYLFLGLSGIIIIRLLQILENSSYKGKFSKRKVLLISGIFYLIGFILTIINVIENMKIYYFNTVIIFFAIFIGILWCILGFFGYKKKIKVSYISILLVSLIFSIGLIYGVFLNTLIIPFHIFLFFLFTLFLQISREIMKHFDLNDIKEEFEGFDNRMSQEKVLKVSLFLQISSIVFLIFLVFFNVSHSILFLALMIASIFFVSIAGILTLESSLERKISNKISSILKIGLLFELISLLIIGS